MFDPDKITYFAETDSRGRRVPFGIKAHDRSKHFYVIGKSGMGKSTLLENMAAQDIQSGNGLVFIDPHGGTAEKLLEYIPPERVNDVIYFAPFDMANPIGFNIMEDVGPEKRHLVVNGLMSVFEKIWEDAWSARMAYILQNTLLALLEYPGSTLLAVNRMYTDKEFRDKVVENVTDVSVKSFWVDEFAKYTDKYVQEATPAIQNKIGQFAGNPLIRNIIGQTKSTFDLRKMMDESKILIVNLSKGRVGEGNARLLGSMLITKIYLAAMSRADEPASVLAKLPPLYLFVDEFQSFADKSFADILSEARKYKLCLTMAHQYIEQMEEEVRDAVFGNVGSMVSFRVGAYDAEVLEKEFAPVFIAEDLVNLGLRQVYLKLMIDSVTSQPFSASTLPPIQMPETSSLNEVIDYSRRTYARPRAEVEELIKKWAEEGRTFTAPKPERSPRATGERRERSDREPERREVGMGRREPKPMDFRGRPAPKREDKEERQVRRDAIAELPSDDFEPLSNLAKKTAHTASSANAVSLSDLQKKFQKNPKSNQREPSPQNLSDLKSALSKIVKTPVEKHAPEPQPQPKPIEARQPQQESPKPAPIQSKSSAAPKEVPEDVLKNLLGVK